MLIEKQTKKKKKKKKKKKERKKKNTGRLQTKPNAPHVKYNVKILPQELMIRDKIDLRRKFREKTAGSSF